MKIKIFTKLTCLALCLVTIFCSGCFSCIENHARKRAKEAMQAKKAIAETYIPQCTDYSLKIVPNNYFKTDEERQAHGFMKEQDFFRKLVYPRYEFWVGNPSIIKKYDRSIEGSGILVSEYKVSGAGTKAYGQDFFHSYCSYAVLFDGKFFLITDVGGTPDSMGYACQAPALYLFDYENDQLLYCGYALEFYDILTHEAYDTIPLWDFQTNDFDYKIVKNTGENKNEEIK